MCVSDRRQHANIRQLEPRTPCGRGVARRGATEAGGTQLLGLVGPGGGNGGGCGAQMDPPPH